MRHSLFFTLWLCATALPIQGQTLSYDFEQSTPSDLTGTLPVTLLSGASIITLADGNHVLATGTDGGYADLGAAAGKAACGEMGTNYAISMNLLIGPENSLSSFCWALALSGGTSQYVGFINQAGGKNWYYEQKSGSTVNILSNSSLATGTWHTLTMTCSGGTATFYIDGVSKGSKAIGSQPNAFASSLTGNYLGKSPFAADAPLKNAYIDNVRFYAQALTAAEVRALHEARPATTQILYDEEQLLTVAREELKLALAARDIHRSLTLPMTSTAGEVRWEYVEMENSSSQGAANSQFSILNSQFEATPLAFDGQTFTVIERGSEAVQVGTLQGYITSQGKEYALWEQPIAVRVAADDNAYGYLYCHMPNMVPQTGTEYIVNQVVTYALGTEADKGLVFTELNRGASVIDGIGTTLPWCRDAFMTKDPQRGCYYLVTTDLYGSRDGGTSMLDNRSIGMFKSYDMIHWSYARCDIKEYLQKKSGEPTPNPSPREGNSTPLVASGNEHPSLGEGLGVGQLQSPSSLSRVWAPQIIFIDGIPYIYYGVGNTDNGDCDHFFISRANEDFTGIETMQVLYDANKRQNILDADIVFLPTDSLYHMSYRDYEHGDLRDITTSSLLEPAWSEMPVSSFTDGNHFEASSVFRRINDDVWNVGNVNYGNNVGYHFHTADALLSHLTPAPDMSGHLSPQHGSFLHVTQTEYELLQAWSDLKALVADATDLLARQESYELTALIAAANELLATDAGEQTDLEALCQQYKAAVEALGARYRLEHAISEATRLMPPAGEPQGASLTTAIAEARQAADTPAALTEAAETLRAATAACVAAMLSEGTAVAVQNGTMSSLSGWTSTGSPVVGSGVGEFFALRKANYSASISRKVTLPAAGYYLVSCQAFERNGENDHTGRDYREGVEQINWQFFAADQSTPVQSLYSVADTGSGNLYGFANNLAGANRLMSASADNFACHLLIHVEEPGDIEIGLRRPKSTVTSSDWCAFDNFTVRQLETTVGIGGIENGELKIENWAGAVYDLSGRRVSDNSQFPILNSQFPKGVYILNGKKIIK